MPLRRARDQATRSSVDPAMTDKVNTDLSAAAGGCRSCEPPIGIWTPPSPNSPQSRRRPAAVQRLKRQKLRLKDMIARAESALIPDLNA